VANAVCPWPEMSLEHYREHVAIFSGSGSSGQPSPVLVNASSRTPARLRRRYPADLWSAICAGGGGAPCCRLLPVVGRFAACSLLVGWRSTTVSTA
jgi:hypothetical protein